jgi:hypothetical protein
MGGEWMVEYLRSGEEEGLSELVTMMSVMRVLQWTEFLRGNGCLGHNVDGTVGTRLTQDVAQAQHENDG